MNPDEIQLALWLDDELSGEELLQMEAWVAQNPQHLAAREENRKYRSLITQALPASVEPPYPDFFMSRLNQGIRNLEAQEKTPHALPKSSAWKTWLMPLAACAGMVFAFAAGKWAQPVATTATVQNHPPAPFIYTPEEGVEAQWFAGNDAEVIVLQGIHAIPDSTDFTETVYVPTTRESERVANRESERTDTHQQ